MASIVKRKKKYSVVYSYTDEKGKEHKKWETFESNAEAKHRKAEIEFEKANGTLKGPSAKTVRELLEDYMSIYGVNTWAMSTYESRRALTSNYINPIIGDRKLADLNPHMMDKYYRDLLKVKSVTANNVHPRNEYLTPHTVREIHKLLRNAFNQGVRWELMTKNPVEHASLPKEEHIPREIWTADILFRAIEACEDDILALALNLAFSCSLRMGEMLGLTWDCVNIEPGAISCGNANIFVNKELQRVNREAYEKLDGKGVLFTFPAVLPSTSTRLVLKEPKTKTSTRKVFLPRTVAEMLVRRRQEIEGYKELFGEEFDDYGLVFCSSNGHPIEGQVINRMFSRLIRDNGFPKVVFHSIRHTSITYKLKINGGDMKSVQGDSGHAQVKMVADVYSHIIDDDRQRNAQRFEEAFYSKPEEQDAAPAGKEEKKEETDMEVLMRLLQKPETAQLLKQLAAGLS